MPAITDPKSIAINMLKSSYYLFSTDLEHLPEEAFDRSFGPACRTVADIVYEVNIVNDREGRIVRSEEPLPWPDGWIKAPQDFRSKETVIAAFKESMDRFIATIERYSDEDLLAAIPDDGETNRYAKCRFVALHNWYHSGQLNFVQTLLGDDGWHW